MTFLPFYVQFILLPTTATLCLPLPVAPLRISSTYRVVVRTGVAVLGSALPTNKYRYTCNLPFLRAHNILHRRVFTPVAN